MIFSKNKISFSKIFFSLFFFGLLFGIVPSTVKAALVNVTGYAWSSNIGWIKFDHGKNEVVKYDTVSGQLSGYAWSDNIGWIKFDGLSASDEAGGSGAKADTSTGLFSGWARACAGTVNASPYQDLPGNCSSMTSRTDGWDGWIKFDNKINGASINNPVKVDLTMSDTRGEFTGYAWGSDVVGWVSFNCSNEGVCASKSDYKVKVILFGGSVLPISVTCSAVPVLATASDEEKTKQLNSFCDDCGNSDKLSTEWTARFGDDIPFSDFLTTEQLWDVKKIGSDIYVTGGVNSVNSADNYDLVLRKYGEDGSLKWEKIWDGGPQDGGLVLAADSSSLYVGGLVREEINRWWFFKSLTNRALLQKYDFNGNLKWTKVWGDIAAGHHEIDGLAVVGRNLYVSHWDSTNGFEKIQAVVKKLDLDELDKSASNDRELRSEQIKWSQSYGDGDKVTTADGHIYADDTGVWITGAFNVSRKSGSLYSGGIGDAYLAKIRSDGEGEWLKTFNFKDEHGYDGYNDGFNLVSDGQYIYIAGVTASSKTLNDWDAMIAKFDKNGNLIWKKSPSGAGAELARGIAVDDQYLYVAHGVSDKKEINWDEGSNWDTVLAKYDKNSGNLARFNYWGESGKDQVTSSLALDKDNKFVYLAGKTTSGATDKDKDFDALLIKASEENSNDSRAIFEASASGGKPPYLYSWSGTDNLSGSDSMVTKSYSTEGIKEAIIKITDNSIPKQTAEKACAIEVIGGAATTTTTPTTTIPPTTPTTPTTTIPPTTPPPVPVSNFTFSVFSGNPLLATIVEGLSANSTVAVLALSGETIGKITVSADLPAAISGAKAQFAVSADNGNTWSAWSDTPPTNVAISAIPKIRIKFVNVPGATPAGTYNVTIRARDGGEGGSVNSLILNLKVERITSGWIEF